MSTLCYRFCFTLLYLHCLHCVSAIVYTSVACYIFNCTFVDSCFSFAPMFSSLALFYIIYASTIDCSPTSSSSNFSMHTRSIDVILGLVYFLTRSYCLLLRKNSTANVLIVFMFWIIICTNCISSLYIFPSAHYEDDHECVSDLIANGWTFNTPSLSTIFNSFSTSILFNNFASSSYLCLCSFLYTSFSLVICCNFSIALSTLILLWTPKLRKCTQLLATNINYFW